MNINATVLVQLATFALLVWLMKRLLWEPLMCLMAEREHRAAAGAAAAERANEMQAAARREAECIMAAADRRGAELAAAMRAEAQAQAEELYQSAQREIDVSVKRVRAQLRAASGELAARAAARLGARPRRAHWTSDPLRGSQRPSAL